MKKRPLRRFYRPGNYLTIQKIGWGLFFVLMIGDFLSSVITPGGILDLPPRLGISLLMISAIIIALGDVMELRSCNRRIRPIELIAKGIPYPLTLLFIIVIFAKATEGEDILLELLLFFGFVILVFNIRYFYDLIHMNRQIVTCAEMKELERQADEAGLSYLQMMENAGTEAFGYICEEEYDWLKGMLIFCGSGNNGGDGFVIARKAAEYGCPATVILPCGEPKTSDAITNYRRILDPSHGEDDNGSTATTGVRILLTDEDTDLTELLDPKDKVIVDSIFGTGFHGEPRGASKKAIEYINDLRHTNMIYAIDVPSGLPGDDGPGGNDLNTDAASPVSRQSPSRGEDIYHNGPSDGSRKRPKFYEAVYADCVISFHARKPIHLNKEPGISDHMRKTIVADIGITRALDPTLQ